MRAPRPLRRTRSALAAARTTPLFAPCLGILAAAMAVPMLHALAHGDERTARAFLYGAVFSAFAAAILGIALASRRLPESPQVELVTLLAGWAVLPCFAAIPLAIVTPGLGWIGAWFEMVACLTTTGSTVYQEPARVPASIHLWRGAVSWLGGLMTLMAAFVVLAPRRMGGFEVMMPTASAGPMVSGDMRLAEFGAQTPRALDRVRRAGRAILPAYAAMTAALVLAFGMAGEVSLAGTVHALGIVSTTGVSAGTGGIAGQGAFAVEAVALVFLGLAATSRIYGRASRVGRSAPIAKDRELRLMAVLVLAATAALFVRHWAAALTLENPSGEVDAFAALWGALFTSLSYLTTTGYESQSWDNARDWAGLSNPTLILLGLCAIGGGAATTAGGIKLIRAAALLGHGLREVDRLAQPAAVRGSGGALGGVLSEGAFLGWAFIMLYAGAIFLVALALATTGLSFETALIGAISAVSNTGPAFGAVAEGHANYALLTPAQRGILALGMILGRVETLAVIAVFRREAWGTIVFGRKNAGNTRSAVPRSGD